MNKYHLLSLGCFIVGIIFFIIGFLSGDVEAGFIVILPFISGSGIYALVGIVFIIIAVLLFMFSFTSSIEYEKTKHTKKTSVKSGGVVLIGPIPIVFGSNWKIAVLLMILAIIIMIIFVIFL